MRSYVAASGAMMMIKRAARRSAPAACPERHSVVDDLSERCGFRPFRHGKAPKVSSRTALQRKKRIPFHPDLDRALASKSISWEEVVPESQYPAAATRLGTRLQSAGTSIPQAYEKLSPESKRQHCKAAQRCTEDSCWRGVGFNSFEGIAHGSRRRLNPSLVRRTYARLRPPRALAAAWRRLRLSLRRWQHTIPAAARTTGASGACGARTGWRPIIVRLR